MDYNDTKLNDNDCQINPACIPTKNQQAEKRTKIKKKNLIILWQGLLQTNKGQHVRKTLYIDDSD